MLPDSFISDLLKTVGEGFAALFTLVLPDAASWVSGISPWDIVIASGILPAPLIVWLLWRNYGPRHHKRGTMKS